MAIAGVGSFARSLADGLAREGRVILGGDLSFTLIQREASADGTRVPATPRRRSRSPRPCARWRAIAGRRGHAGRDQGGRRRLSALRRGRSSIRRRRSPTRLAQRDGVFGAAADPTLLARLDLKPGDADDHRQRDDRNPRRAHAPSRTSSPAASASGRACWSARTRLRATGLLQPGSLVRWHYRLRLPAERRQRRRRQAVIGAGARAIARRRLGNPHPHQRLAAARAQRRALHAISHAGRADRAAGRRRRRRQCGEKPSRPQARRDRHDEGARRDRRRVFAIYLSQVLLLALIGGVIGARARRGAAVPDRLDASARSFRCRSRRRCIRPSWRWRCSTAC